MIRKFNDSLSYLVLASGAYVCHIKDKEVSLVISNHSWYAYIMLNQKSDIFWESTNVNSMYIMNMTNEYNQI